MNKSNNYFSPNVTLRFEENHIGCAWCPFEETYSRKQCRLTGVYIIDDKCVDYWCPFQEEAAQFQLNQKIKNVKEKSND